MAYDDRHPVTTGGTDDKGRVVEKETYDRGSYTETITRVTTDTSKDIYVDKTPK